MVPSTMRLARSHSMVKRGAQALGVRPTTQRGGLLYSPKPCVRRTSDHGNEPTFGTLHSRAFLRRRRRVEVVPPRELPPASEPSERVTVEWKVL